MARVATLLTAEDLLKLPSDLRCELIDGLLIEMPLNTPEHGAVGANLAFLLGLHVRKNKLGRIFTGDVGFVVRRNPDTVRAPDIAFIRSARLPVVR